MKIKTWIGVSLTLVSTLALSAHTTLLTQSSSQTPNPFPNSIACFSSGLNSNWRAYDLAPLNLPAPLVINSVQFGIQDAVGSPPVTVNVYTSNGAFPGAPLQLEATQTVNLPDQSQTLFTLPLAVPTQPLPINSIVVLELSYSMGGGINPIIGSNGAGQSAPGYISAPDCGISTPATLTSVGFPDVHIILNAIGSTGLATLEENLASATSAINALMQPEILGPAQKALLVNMLGLVSRYKDTPYRSLSLSALNAVIIRVDGCALRSTPDTVFTHGIAGMDFVTTCPGQAPIYNALKAAQTLLAGP